MKVQTLWILFALLFSPVAKGDQTNPTLFSPLATNSYTKFDQTHTNHPFAFLSSWSLSKHLLTNSADRNPFQIPRNQKPYALQMQSAPNTMPASAPTSLPASIPSKPAVPPATRPVVTPSTIPAQPSSLPKTLPETPRTFLAVTSTPSGAKVWLEEKVGDPVGITPFRTEVTPGIHLVFLEKEGFLLKQETLTVTTGQSFTLDSVLETIAPVLVSIRSNAVGAKVYINDRASGVAGIVPFQTSLSPGSYTIIAEQDGYETVERTVDIQPDAIAPFLVTLTLQEGRYGLLQVKSNVLGTTVAVDGKQVGVTPFEKDLPKITEGKHEVVLSCEGYVSWEGEITVSRGETVQMKAELAKKTKKTGAIVSFLFSGGFAVGGIILGNQAQSIFSSIQSDIDQGLLVDDQDPRFREGFLRGLAADVSFGLSGVSFLFSVSRFVAKGKSSRVDVFTSVLKSRTPNSSKSGVFVHNF